MCNQGLTLECLVLLYAFVVESSLPAGWHRVALLLSCHLPGPSILHIPGSLLRWAQSWCPTELAPCYEFVPGSHRVWQGKTRLECDP